MNTITAPASQETTPGWDMDRWVRIIDTEGFPILGIIKAVDVYGVTLWQASSDYEHSDGETSPFYCHLAWQTIATTMFGPMEGEGDPFATRSTWVRIIT